VTKKVLFLLNTYQFQKKYINYNKSLYKNNLIIDKIDESWFNFFYHKLKKNFIVKKDYPNLSSKINSDTNYDYLKLLIKKFKPELIFSTMNNEKIEELLSEFKDIKKVLWISFETNQVKLDKLKKTYNYLVTNNNTIYSTANKLKFKTILFDISAPFNLDLKKNSFFKRKDKIFFSGSLGNNFKYRFKILNYLNKNFEMTVRIRNLVEKFKFLNIINFYIIKFFPKISQALYEKKILPLTNNLKFINKKEVFGSEMISELKKHKICINIHSDFGKDQSINMRVYEALSCGCLLISDRNHKMEKLLKNYKHVVYFSDQKDLYDKIEYYQNNVNDAYKIAKNGNRFFINHLSSERKFDSFLKIIKKII